MFLGPTEAREAATATFTRVGKSAIASFALPSNTVFCSLCNASLYTEVPFRESAPFSVAIDASLVSIRDTVRKIGRASCRERVNIGVDVVYEEKNETNVRGDDYVEAVDGVDEISTVGDGE